MTRFKLDTADLQLSAFLERVTRVKVKDCFTERDVIYVIVPTGILGKFLGKGAINVKRLQQKLNKKIRAVEYNEDVTQFIKNFIMPLKVESVELHENEVLIKDSNKKTKSLLIGRESRNLQLLNRAVKRFFSVNIKVE